MKSKKHFKKVAFAVGFAATAVSTSAYAFGWCGWWLAQCPPGGGGWW